ncbi:hypothetical protein TNCV_85301 [Trichonephila clavipes]|nr:hypothetical protein TNCV_85301 [Trichonephila clavipes]
MGISTARNVSPAGSEYAETVRSNHCRGSNATRRKIDLSNPQKSLGEIFNPTASTAVHNSKSVVIARFWAQADCTFMSYIYSVIFMSCDLGAQIINWECPDCSSKKLQMILT